MNRLRMALIFFEREVTNSLETLLNMESEDLILSGKVYFSELSKEEKFIFICKLIINWYTS
jgi:hypothetical protein